MDWKTILAAIGPIIIGCFVQYFRPFVEPSKEFRSRIKLLRNGLTERLSVLHATLLKHVLTCADEEIRGDGRSQQDLVGDLTRETFRLSTIFHRCETIQRFVQWAYRLLFYSAALGVVLLIVAVISEKSHPYVIGIGVVTIVLQIALVRGLVFAANQLAEYEETT